MKRELLTMAVAGVWVIGCDSSGLSPREVPGRTQSALLYETYEHELGAGATAAPAAKPLRLPARVAVVQVGEVSPPAAMMDVLRSDPSVFAVVQSLPGAEPYVPPPDYGSWSGSRWSPPVQPQAAPPRPTLAAIRRLAGDVGMDYVLLVGGTIDRNTTATPLSLLDITIVGGFLVPSRETRAVARGSAALVDVPSGRVVLNSSAEAQKHSTVPSASVAGEEVKLLESVRDDVVARLGAHVLADARSRAGFSPAAAGGAPYGAPVMGQSAPGSGWQTLPPGTPYPTGPAGSP
jgi:hypothetical protein